MSDKIIIVTTPDDILVDGFRILLFDLNREQEILVSESLKTVDTDLNLIVYVSNHPLDIDWTLDKKLKSNCIIFNAESNNQTIVGYLAGLKNSAFLGTLRDLDHINNCVLYTEQDCIDFLENKINLYE